MRLSVLSLCSMPLLVLVNGGAESRGIEADEPVARDECSVCEECPSDPYQHIATDSETGVVTWSHSGCLGVHFNACINAPEHGVCPGAGGGGGEDPDPDPGGAIAAVRAWVEMDNVRAAHDLVRAHAWVHFVPERSAIQIEGCTGALVAHLPLPHAFTLALLAEE